MTHTLYGGQYVLLITLQCRSFNSFGALTVTRERPIRLKRPMSDVPIFRRKNLVVWWCFSRPGGQQSTTANDC